MDMDISVLEKMGISVVRTMDKRYKISTSQNSKFNLEEHLVKELISLVNRNYLIDTESLIKYLNIRLYYGSRIAALFLNNNTVSERLKKLHSANAH